MSSNALKINFFVILDSETFQVQEPIAAFPYAVKMMFNYDAESNASSILRSMYCETVPARVHYSNAEVAEWEKRYATLFSSYYKSNEQ